MVSGACASLGPWFCTEIVYVPEPPAVNVPTWLLVTWRLAFVTIVVGSVLLLLVVLLSYVGDVTDAVLSITVPFTVFEGVETTRLIGFAVAPLARPLPYVQVTVPALNGHVQLVPVAETNDSPVGIASVTTIGLAAVDGPMLVTLSVYVPLAPALKFPVWLLVIARSARPMNACAVALALLYGPESVPVAPESSVHVENTVFVCGFDGPVPGVVCAARLGVASYVIVRC